MSTVELCCPHCTSTRLRSDETAQIGYPVLLTLSDHGGIEVEYTGESYDVWDEGTTYEGDIWCRDCGAQVSPQSLVTDRCPDCRDHPGWAHGDESRRREPRDVCKACLGSGLGRALSLDEPEPPKYPATVVTVSVASRDDDGCQYTLTYPDGKVVTLGNAEDNYQVLAEIIDAEHAKN